jgi:hypothetical protein
MVLVGSLAPCWYWRGLVRQFCVGMIVAGESRTFPGRRGFGARVGAAVISEPERLASCKAGFPLPECAASGYLIARESYSGRVAY